MIHTFLDKLLPQTFSSTDLLIILFLFIIFLLIFNLWKIKKLGGRINLIPGLETNQQIIKNIDDIYSKIYTINKDIININKKTNSLSLKSDTILKTKTIKYNPYKDMGVGGNQSFSTILLDTNGDGFIVTNLYSRERTRVLLKEICSFLPQQELAPEEKELLEGIK